MLAEAQRQALLQAMGIDIYVMRDKASPPSEVGDSDDVCTDMDVVVVCAEDPSRNAHAGNLRRHLPKALGVQASRVRWLRCRDGGELPELPLARACLILGSALAESLRSTQSHKHPSMMIAVADTPDQSLRNALTRRALWEALKPLRRHLAQCAH